jgi:hypothetical protein
VGPSISPRQDVCAKAPGILGWNTPTEGLGDSELDNGEESNQLRACGEGGRMSNLEG